MITKEIKECFCKRRKQFSKFRVRSVLVRLERGEWYNLITFIRFHHKSESPPNDKFFNYGEIALLDKSLPKSKFLKLLDGFENRRTNYYRIGKVCFSNLKEFEHVSLRTRESYGGISITWPGDLFISRVSPLQDSLESEESKEKLSRITGNPLAKPNLPFYPSLENAAEHFLNFRAPLNGSIYVILPDYRARNSYYKRV